MTQQNNIIFRYINTKHNPADLPARGIWWNGPEWLLQAIEKWPQHCKFLIFIMRKNPSKQARIYLF